MSDLSYDVGNVERDLALTPLSKAQGASPASLITTSHRAAWKVSLISASGEKIVPGMRVKPAFS